MRNEVDTLDATPSKRLFLSIIADYDLNKCICELVDNGLDVWVRGGEKRRIKICIDLDVMQQSVTIEDNAGGLAREEMHYVISPGQTGTSPTDATIGMFGVGTKRAVVALAQDVRIRTRFGSNPKSYEVDFNDDWFATEDWSLPLYETEGMAPGTTIVFLQRLRFPVTDEAVAHLREHLSMTYARFIASGNVKIIVNGGALEPQFFESWAYPPTYGPRRYIGSLPFEDSTVNIEAVAGLSSESSPVSGEYGVYFYCNNRLVARALKTFEVGFAKGLAGLPHPNLSLVRVIVSLRGDARAMPWNSSKSDINTNHEAFRDIHDWLVLILKEYASLSRNWLGEWPEKVFKYKTGSIEDVAIANFKTARKSYLPPLPKAKPRFADVIAAKNAAVVRNKPWTRGLYEGIIAADLISKQRLEQKNRLSFIVLDSTLEIAFKEYLVSDSGRRYADADLAKIFAQRHLVHTEIKKTVTLTDATWKKIVHYYRMRCKLIHERADVGISDSDIKEFRGIVERVLTKLFKLRFAKDD